MPSLAKKNKIDPDAAAAFVCVIPFADNTSIYTYELELRGDHPAVTGHPDHWRSKDTPRSEWPSVLDSVIQAGDEADAREAEANRVKLVPPPAPPPAMMLCTTEIVTTRGGEPCTIVRGSKVLADDELVAAHPDCWTAA